MNDGWDYVVPQVNKLDPGVSFRKVSMWRDALVVFGGWGVQDDGARAWADALLAAPGVNVFASVGRAFAVRGPVDSKDGRLEAALKNSAIVKRLQLDGGANRVYAIAHSSGSKFLREFLGQCHKAGLTCPIQGWNLDGFALNDDRIAEVHSNPRTNRNHMRLVNEESVLTSLSAAAVNLDYVRLDKCNVHTDYLSK